METCTKLAYKKIGKAHAKILRNFMAGNGTYGVYECTRCLDFHLTSRYDNRSQKMRRACINNWLRVPLPRVTQLLHERTIAMHQHLKGVKYKGDILDLKTQKQLISQLNN